MARLRSQSWRTGLKLPPAVLHLTRLRSAEGARLSSTWSLRRASPRLLCLLRLPFLVAVVSHAPSREVAARADLVESLVTSPHVRLLRRRGTNSEPVVEGLYETQVVMDFDGTRTSAAGPARMDSDLSHIDSVAWTVSPSHAKSQCETEAGVTLDRFPTRVLVVPPRIRKMAVRFGRDARPTPGVNSS